VQARVVETLAATWTNHASENAVRSYLAGFDLTHHQMQTLLEKFGTSIVSMLKHDPYLLIKHLDGYGFKRVDAIALKTGVAKTHPGRIAAALSYCLSEQVRSGHTWTAGSDLVDQANEALLALEREARARAEAALDPDADLESLATAIPVAGTPLSVGVSVWEEGALLRWAGHVPGPARAAPTSRPLIVDHGFRRYLTVAARDGVGRIGYADVSLGITRDLFPRLGVGEDPGRPLSDLTGLQVRVLVEPPEASPRALDRVVPIPEGSPWVWLSVGAPAGRDERRIAMQDAGRSLARWLLAAVLVAATLGLRHWPHGGGGARTFRKIVPWLAGLAVLRWTLDHADLFSLALAGGPSPPLLFEPAYFATTRGLGLLRNVMEFLVTALTLAVGAFLLLPAGLRLLGRGRPTTRALGLVLAGLLAGLIVRGLGGLQEVVAQNANPKLIGLDAPFFTLPFLVLHLAMLLTALAGIGWILLGWERGTRGLRGAVGWSGLAGIGLGLWAWGDGSGVVLAVWIGLLPLLGLGIRPAVLDPSFARRVVAGLLAVLWLAGFQSQGLEEVYTDLKEGVASQRAEERMHPGSNWRSFLLEDLLRELSQDTAALDLLTDPFRDRSNAAFELWAGSSLSAPLGYWGSRLELVGADGRTLSEFDLGLPYESRPVRSWRVGRPEPGQTYTVEAIELGTDEGPFLVYRGVLFLDQIVPDGDASVLVVDLPYAAQDPAAAIDLATAGPAALGFASGRRLDPRRDFESPILLARLDDSGVVAASDPVLLDLPLDRLPRDGGWISLRLGTERYRTRRVSSEDTDDVAVAFEEAGPADRVLDTSRLVALYVLSAALLLGGLLVLRAGRRQAPWPRFLGEFGFQERLLGSIVLVVILPLFISGVFHERRGGTRLRNANLEEVEHRLDTASHLLASHLDDLTTALVAGEYVQDVLREGNTTARRDLGPFESSQIMVFGPDDRVLLDETLRDLDVAEARAFLASVEPGQLVLESDGGVWFLGRSYPVTGPDGETYRVFVRKLLTDEDLARVGRTVGCDLTLYDGPWAVVSSQDYLYKAGLLPPVLPVEAKRVVLDGVSRRAVQAEGREGLVVATGYAVVAGVDTPRRGVLAARLFTRATQAAEEQRQAQLFLFGLSSLAFVLAVAVGLLLSARIVDPIRNLVAATQRVGGGDLEVQLPERGEDEVGQLVRSFNRMTTQLRQSQRSLAARRGFLESILGNLSAGVLVIDAGKRVQEANAVATRLLEGQESEMLARFEALGPPRELVATEVTLPAEDGPRTLRVVIDPIQLETGEAGWLVLFDDVTELLANRRLALYAEMARQVAHEVKNPLTPIQLAAQMVRQACQDDHPRLQEIVGENVEQIESQVTRLREIASEFSLLGREGALELAPVALGPLLADLRDAYPSADGRLEVTVDAPDDLAALASREELTKVLTNLVENAMQAMGGAGRIQLTAGADGDRAWIRVADEGPGIPPEVEDRLFEPYFSTKSTGTGLGLLICRNLMEKMGGSIRLGNRPDGAGAAAELSLARVVP